MIIIFCGNFYGFLEVLLKLGKFQLRGNEDLPPLASKEGQQKMQYKLKEKHNDCTKTHMVDLESGCDYEIIYYFV